MIGNDPLDLGGQIAFVTGAGQGAGRAIALQLARHNAGGVAVNDFVPERAAAVVAEIEALGVRALAVPADVGDHAAVSAAMATANSKLGPVTLLVNNAGNAGPDATMGQSPLFWETKPEDWDRYFHTNLHGVMNCCHAALPGMVKQGKGRIVTIVSDAGRVGEAKLTAYAAAKAGAAGFVRAIAKEAGRFGITCERHFTLGARTADGRRRQSAVSRERSRESDVVALCDQALRQGRRRRVHGVVLVLGRRGLDYGPDIPRERRL